jgi:hypothetical protein
LDFAEAMMAAFQKIVIGGFSAIVGAAIVAAGLKYSVLNWIVDAPGWVVGRFFSLDFHEGEGAFRLFLALSLSWTFHSGASWPVMEMNSGDIRRASRKQIVIKLYRASSKHVLTASEKRTRAYGSI